jgi:hypothetical protein
MCFFSLSLYGIWDKSRFSAVYFGFLNHLSLDVFFFPYSFLCYSHSYLYLNIEKRKRRKVSKEVVDGRKPGFESLQGQTYV